MADRRYFSKYTHRFFFLFTNPHPLFFQNKKGEGIKMFFWVSSRPSKIKWLTIIKMPSLTISLISVSMGLFLFFFVGDGGTGRDE